MTKKKRELSPEESRVKGLRALEKVWKLLTDEKGLEPMRAQSPWPT